MSFIKTLITGGPDPVLAQTVNPFQTAEGQTTFGQAQDVQTQQQRFVDALASQNGLSNQSQVFGQQQALANQLQGVANGTGPNPALAQFNQATGQNVANQAALMAGQRGANANVGLLARQIAQQGANTQQQAAGQSAVLQAQQQLAGMGALGSQQQALAQQANQMVNNQAQGIAGLQQGANNNQNAVLGAYGAQNNSNVAATGSVNAANAAQTAAAMGIAGSVAGGLASGAGAALVGKKYDGGLVGSYAQGGPVNQSGPQGFTARYLLGLPQLASEGGPIVQQGQAPVPGNSPVNDTVPAMLSPNEIVIPRSITMSANAPSKAAEFVAQILARQNLKRG